MNIFYRSFPILLGLLLSNELTLFAKAIQPAVVSESLVLQDTSKSRVFDTERDLAYFIVEDLGLQNSKIDFASAEVSKKDSLFEALNLNKEISFPTSYLGHFSNFIIAPPIAEKIMAQTVDLAAKDKLAKFSFEVKEGDRFFLKFDVQKGAGFGMYVEVLLNNVKIADEFSLKRKEEFAMDFEVAKPGMVDVVFRNFGFLRLQGNLDVEVLPRKQKIKFEEISIAKVHEKEERVMLRDTLFSTLMDDSVLVSHGLNLKGISVFQRQLDLPQGKELLGFAVFLFPQDQKQKMEFQRRETLREDGLQDFALKELLGKSYTYLPEFGLKDIDFSVFDQARSYHWLNGQNIQGSNWELSPNSKRNYAFFGVRNGFSTDKIFLRVTNKSSLYDQDLGLQVVAIFVESFSVVQQVEVQEFEKIIRLSLI